MQIVHRPHPLGSLRDQVNRLRNATRGNIRETLAVFSADEYTPAARDLFVAPDAEIGKAVGARATTFYTALQSGASLSPFLVEPYPGPQTTKDGTPILASTSPTLWALDQALRKKLAALNDLVDAQMNAEPDAARKQIWAGVKVKLFLKRFFVDDVVAALAATMAKWPAKAAELQREFSRIPLKRESVSALKEFRKKVSTALQNLMVDNASASALIATTNGWISQFTEGAADLSAAQADEQLIVNAESMGLDELLGTIASVREKKPELATKLQAIYARRKAEADKKAEEEKKKKMLMIGGGVAALALVLYLTRRK